ADMKVLPYQLSSTDLLLREQVQMETSVEQLYFAITKAIINIFMDIQRIYKSQLVTRLNKVTYLLINLTLTTTTIQWTPISIFKYKNKHIFSTRNHLFVQASIHWGLMSLIMSENKATIRKEAVKWLIL